MARLTETTQTNEIVSNLATTGRPPKFGVQPFDRKQQGPDPYETVGFGAIMASFPMNLYSFQNEHIDSHRTNH